MSNKNKFPDPKDIKEGLHFFIEGSQVVFTEAYHLLRGFCCGNGCRHCPYTKKANDK